ncbi:MAG: hypothetical protein GC137_06790 [Alphaproteobacteria bacterium]|nr:hypothetical protein [Alphaproteobacteria bacterium]
MPEFHDGMRESIAKFLPKALERALCSYRQFVKKAYDKKDAAEFKKHHEAVKPVLAHIELLLKLAQKADLPDSHLADEQTNKEIEDMMHQAQEEIESRNFKK